MRLAWQHGQVESRRSIALLAVGHACVDVYQGAVAALVPVFVAERAYTYAAASGIVLAASLLSSLVQPLFGLLTDRHAMPWLLPVSTVLGGLGIALSGLSRSYPVTLLFVAIAGLGVAAYHPESARLARMASEGSHRSMAWFSTGGNIGFALAPLLVGVAVGAGGLAWTPVLLVPALVGAVISVPVIRALGPRPDHATQQGVTRREDDVRSFIKMTVAVVFRSIAFIGLSTFIALYAQQRMGAGPAAGTAALFILYLGGIVGSVLGGSLVSRWDRVRVSRWSYLVTAIAIAGVVWAPGPAIYLFVAMASAGLYVPFSLQVTLAQDYLPSRVGTASGITLGLTVSIGGLASPILGVLADATTLQAALAPLTLMPIFSWLMFRLLREPSIKVPAKARPDAANG